MTTPTKHSLTRTLAEHRRELAALRHDHAELLAAARAAVCAHYDGQALPLAVLIDTLDQLGQLPEFSPYVTDAALDFLDASADLADSGQASGPAALASGRRVA
ncbi:hypothetical protein [Streptomyces spirodelae]|uniref:Uncharacterized protein n=1 Tax=Streptomyces spirodelae TaxID=2812904 RepID=A0ABS3X0D7_9ACTN|nr:hypothetical protein [Streptomyces spirodelae]MBO8188832.1 hypothetical protein [Streptomyces spirodelae]